MVGQATRGFPACVDCRVIVGGAPRLLFGVEPRFVDSSSDVFNGTVAEVNHRFLAQSPGWSAYRADSVVIHSDSICALNGLRK